MAVEEQKSSKAKTHFVVMTFLFLGGIGLAVYANTWKEQRRVGEVVVEGNRIVPSKEILALAKVPANSLLFELDLFGVEQRVLKNDYVKSVAVHRDIPNRVRIVIEERIPVAALLADRLYYLDADGVVLPQASSEFIVDLPVLTGVPVAEAVPGRQIKNKNVLDALHVLSVAAEIDEAMYRNISEIRIEGAKDFVFYTAEFGVPVLLGREQVGEQLVKFDSFWKSVAAPEGAYQLQYVDLRFDDQVVVRWNHDDGDVHS